MAKYDRNALPHRTLKRGMEGADVKRLQVAVNTQLKRHGSKARVKTDGHYGAATDKLFGRACYVFGLVGAEPTVKRQRLIRWRLGRSKEQKAREKARRPKRPKAGQLTPNFHLSEFNCRDGTKVPSYMADDLKVWCQRFGEPLRRKYGACVINSGYRHTAYNRRIGGESNSFHIYTVRKSQPAADQMYSKGSAAQWGATAKALRGSSGGVGIYPSSRFIHCDTRNYISNWWG